MAILRFIDKQGKVVKEDHEREINKNSLQPIPRLIEEDGKKWRFDFKDGVVNVYKESDF